MKTIFENWNNLIYIHRGADQGIQRGGRISLQTVRADDPRNPDLDSRQVWLPNELESSQSICHCLIRQIQRFFFEFPDCDTVNGRSMYGANCPGNPNCQYPNPDQVPIRQNQIKMSLCLDYKALDRTVLDHIRRNFKNIIFQLIRLKVTSIVDGPWIGPNRYVRKITYDDWIFSSRASRLICFRVKTKE